MRRPTPMGGVMELNRPVVRTDVAVVELDGEAVIYDEHSEKLHHLNPTATLLYTLCDGTATVAELANDLAAEFEIPLEEMEHHLRHLVGRLHEEGLLIDAQTPPQEGSSSDRPT